MHLNYVRCGLQNLLGNLDRLLNCLLWLNHSYRLSNCKRSWGNFWKLSYLLNRSQWCCRDLLSNWRSHLSSYRCSSLNYLLRLSNIRSLLTLSNHIVLLNSNSGYILGFKGLLSCLLSLSHNSSHISSL